MWTDKKRKLLPYAALALISLGMLALSRTPDCLPGSSCDWYSQYVSIAETMRRTFYETGTLFPGRLPLGGGANIYDFSYYGCLRPDVLIGCALPAVSMTAVITAYCTAGYTASALLFYRLLGKCGIENSARFWGAVLFLSAGCFFQVHRQIVFINYMPFLLGAMLAVCGRPAVRIERRGTLILMLTLIIFHSYYFAVPCILSVYAFLLWKQADAVRTPRSWFSISCNYAVCVFCAVLLSGVLLLPSAASILNCASSKDGGAAAARNPLALRPDFSGFLYSAYGYGLTLTLLFLLLCGVFCRTALRLRLLCIFLLSGVISGLLPYVLNGFLYSRSKVLIPFLPLAVLSGITVFRKLLRTASRPSAAALALCGYAGYLQYRSSQNLWIWADFSIAAAAFAFLSARRFARIRSSGEKESLRRPLSLILPAAALLSVCVSFSLHRSDEYLSPEHTQVSDFPEETRTQFYSDRTYRFDSFQEPYQSVNQLALAGAGRTSAYTSTPNPLYSSFFFDIMRNPIRINNRVALLSQANPFFQYLMGVRYLECSREALPYGYEIYAKQDTSVLAENPAVLPLCYGSTSVMAEDAFDQLSFPESLEAITARSIVDSGASSESFPSHFRELFWKEGTDYTIERLTDASFDIIPAAAVKDQILVLTFDVKRRSADAAVVTINGIRNKLSGSGAPYPNRNTTFTFVLSSPYEMDRFHVSASGDFSISNLHLYALDTEHFGMSTDAVHPLESRGLSGNEVVNGTLSLPDDGWLITSIPMEPGFLAWVDGKPCGIHTVNKSFVGLPLSAGSHTVRIVFQPPLQGAGILCSAAGTALFLFLAALGRCRRNLQKHERNGDRP